MITAPRSYAQQSSALVVGVAAVSLAVLGSIAVSRSPGLVLLLLIAGPVAGIGAVVLGSWRIGVYVFLAWLLVEDLPRKFLGNDMRLYFVKDALAAILYLAFFAAWIRGREPRPRIGFWGPLLLFVGWGLVEVFNPESPSVIYGLLGLRLYFFYVPLLFVGYALLRDERDLGRFLVFNLLIATVIAGLGIVQGIVGLDFLNPPKLAPELNELGRLVREVPSTGALVPRVTSVFVSDGRFAWYMLVMFLLGVGGVAYFVSCRARGAGMAAVAVGAIAVATMLSGVRGTFMYALSSVGVLAAAFFYGAGPRLRWVPRVLALGLATVGLALLIVLMLYPKAVAARWALYYETIAPWSPTSELANRVWDYPIGNLLGAFTFPSWPLGYGIGTSSLGVQYVTGRLGLPALDIGVENGYGTLILELGIVGPALWLLWTVTLVREGWRTVRRLRGTPLFPLGFAILWFLLLLLFPITLAGMQQYQNYVLDAYLWLLAGVLFRLPTMVRA